MLAADPTMNPEAEMLEQFLRNEERLASTKKTPLAEEQSSFGLPMIAEIESLNEQQIQNIGDVLVRKHGLVVPIDNSRQEEMACSSSSEEQSEFEDDPNLLESSSKHHTEVEKPQPSNLQRFGSPKGMDELAARLRAIDFASSLRRDPSESQVPEVPQETGHFSAQLTGTQFQGSAQPIRII